MPVYQIRDRAGMLIAEHVRTATPTGKQMAWRRGGHNHLDGYGTANLPLYGTQWIDRVPIGRTIILCEGEAATEALWRWRLPALGTVTGASGTPGAEALGVLLPYDMVTWEDFDEAGAAHMQRLAAWLVGQGCTPRRLRWGEQKGDDAADFQTRGGTRQQLGQMLQEAAPWSVEPPAPPRPLRPRGVYPERSRGERLGAQDDRRERARNALIEVVSAAWGEPLHLLGRSAWWRCRLHDGDRDPSFKVDTREPYFRCFGCGARGDVFTFKQLTEHASFKEVLLELVPMPRQLVDSW